MKTTHDETYPPTVTVAPPRRPSRRPVAAAAIVVAVLAAGAVGRYSGGAPARSVTTPAASRPEVAALDPAPHTTATQHTAGTSTPTRETAIAGTAGADLTQSQIRLDTEAKLGINLDDFNKAEQDFLIGLAAGGGM